MKRALLGLTFVVSACHSAALEQTRGPDARIDLSPGSAWVLVHGGSSPVVRARDGARFVYLFGDPLGGDQHNLPGLGLGDARGPNLGLLSGQFAPLVLFPDPTHSPMLALSSTGAALHIAARRVAIDVRGSAMTLRGAPYLAIPADHTEVRGTEGGRPSFLVSISAGDRPSLTAPLADRIDIDAPRFGRIRVGSADCDRPLLAVPVPRGSTSVFLVRFGPPPPPSDPLFFVEPTDPRASRACPETATSTLSQR